MIQNLSFIAFPPTFWDLNQGANISEIKPPLEIQKENDLIHNRTIKLEKILAKPSWWNLAWILNRPFYYINADLHSYWYRLLQMRSICSNQSKCDNMFLFNLRVLYVKLVQPSPKNHIPTVKTCGKVQVFWAGKKISAID